MANIMSQVKLKNHTSRDGFDLSRKNAFTAKIGELLPVACIECIPGDSVEGKIQHFTRTMPINTAAYTRVREYYDWFFVPTNLLWNKFNTFVTQMVDNNQHATSIISSQVLTNEHPYFTTFQLAQGLFKRKIAGDGNSLDPLAGVNIFGYKRWELQAKLLNYLGYGDFSAIKDLPSTNQNPSMATLFRDNLKLNPFPLLAYQKIYQDYYRNSQWENANASAFNIDYISGAANSLNIPLSQVDSAIQENMLDLRYCNWNKDLFMGLLPNAQYGAASIIDTGSGNASVALNFGDTSNFTSLLRVGRANQTYNSGETIQVASSSSSVPGFYETKTSGVTAALYQGFSASEVSSLRNALGLSSTNSSVDISTSFSILALRQAEALQKWKEITQSQQQDYKNQIEAHFGVSPSEALSERCQFIDGTVSNLDISEVTNTNLVDNAAAEIAGKGVGVGQGSFKFKTKVHGYLMCIYHAVPLLDYASDGVKRTNLKTMVTDYAIPEFDQTGMVQVSTNELTNSADTNGFTADLLGYAPRYYDYKQAIDEVHGAFIDGGLGSWVAPIDKNYIDQYLASRLAESGSITYQWFKVNPAVLNPIFAQDVDSSTSTDQLLVNASFDIKAVRNLDRNGLPY